MSRACQWRVGIVVLLWVSQAPLWSWTEAHNQASRVAAQTGPEPFRSHAEWAAFGVYPDRMNDWGIAQYEYGRWATRLLVRQAIDALRRGHASRACFLASVASHFAQDDIAMSHSPVFRLKHSDPEIALLPPLWRQRLDRLPVALRQAHILRYGRGSPRPVEGPFFVSDQPPPLLSQLYASVQGYAHDWLEGTASALWVPAARARIVGAGELGNSAGWNEGATLVREMFLKESPWLAWWDQHAGNLSFYLLWLVGHYHGQWLLPWRLFRWETPENSYAAFESRDRLLAVFAAEFRIAVEVTRALYRYVTLASRTRLESDWGPFAAEDPRLDGLACAGTVVVRQTDSPAAELLQSFLYWELLSGRERRCPDESPLIERAQDSRPLGALLRDARWAGQNLILLRQAPAGRIRISRRPGQRQRVVVILESDSPQALSAVVDLWLDESRAWLWGRGPSELIEAAQSQVWAGARLARELRQKGLDGRRLLEFVQPADGKIPFRNDDRDKAWMAEQTQMSRLVPLSQLLRHLAKHLHPVLFGE